MNEKHKDDAATFFAFCIYACAIFALVSFWTKFQNLPELQKRRAKKSNQSRAC